MYIFVTCRYHTTATMFKPEQTSVAVQCNLLQAPPLVKLSHTADTTELDDSFSEVEEIDLDTSFHLSQQDKDTVTE